MLLPYRQDILNDRSLRFSKDDTYLIGLMLSPHIEFGYYLTTWDSKQWSFDEIDISILQERFRLIVERHSILRTTYHLSSNKTWVSNVCHSVEPCLIYIQLKSIKEIYDTISMIRQQERIDIEEGPCLIKLWVFGLIHSSQMWCFALIHHICFDAHSIVPLQRELFNPTYETIPLQYVLFSDTMSSILDNLSTPEIDWWSSYLSSFPYYEMDVQVDRLPSRKSSGLGSTLCLLLSNCDKLTLILRQQRTSLYNFCHLSLLYLSRYMLQNSYVCLGGINTQRFFSHLNNTFPFTIGYFINQVMYCHKLDNTTSWINHLQLIKKSVNDMQIHSYIPSSIWKHFSPLKHSLQRIQWMTQTYVGTDGDTTYRDHHFSSGLFYREYDWVKFDLSFLLFKRSDQLLLQLQYNKDLYDKDTSIIIIEQWKRIIEWMLSDSFTSHEPCLTTPLYYTPSLKGKKGFKLLPFEIDTTTGYVVDEQDIEIGWIGWTGTQTDGVLFLSKIPKTHI